MEIKSASMMDYMLRQAIDINVLQKKMTADVQAMQSVMEMADDVSKITGSGGKLDLKG